MVGKGCYLFPSFSCAYQKCKGVWDWFHSIPSFPGKKKLLLEKSIKSDF